MSLPLGRHPHILLAPFFQDCYDVANFFGSDITQLTMASAGIGAKKTGGLLPPVSTWCLSLLVPGLHVSIKMILIYTCHQL